jgi:hypothetical protein
VVAGGRRGKDDRKQNKVVALRYQLSSPHPLLSMRPFVSSVPVAEHSRMKLLKNIVNCT